MGFAIPAPSVGSGVMALDTGNVPEEFRNHPDWKDPAPSIADAATLGDGLRQAREASGRSLSQLSTATRVHSRYLTALEQNDWSSLPSRVFSVGYVRAYAGALGLDEQLAVERFKRECPDPSVPLQPPVGVAFQEVRRYSPRVIGALALVAVAVVGWNVFQRVSLARAPAPSALTSTPESWTLGAVPGQTVALSVPLAAPPDQTIPALYVTPGLEDQLAGTDTAETQAAAAAHVGPVQKAFNPRGAVYGASATASQVVLQARKAASLVVRMADGRVLFARQLAAGEAWRAPIGVSAVIDASEPNAFDIYLNGEHGGALQGVLTPLQQLNARAGSVARQMAADAEAARAAAARGAMAAIAPSAQAATAPAAPPRPAPSTGPVPYTALPPAG
ncbi:helix-turn-helix domain-containing protein [Brevundimonas sp.]|uniref:helix-turn-helix domain-containing protein n=1 Tax=Brevundimonas sp. TaxID=1871086 RepID=UPI0025BCDA99|nr:helix-turn-helix transcriptional regulator [Brevundimonas sp.]